MTSLYFEKLSMYERIEEPCTVAVPYPQSALADCSTAAVKDGERAVPTQTKATALWPDGSVKWLLAHFLADLPGNSGKRFTLVPEGEAPAPTNPATAEMRNGAVVIRTGAIVVELAGPGEAGLFRSTRIASDEPSHAIAGPTIRDEANRSFDCKISSDGWRILEQGPVRCAAEARGKHYSAADECRFDFVARVYAYAGKPWLTIEYQIINKEAEPSQTLHAAELFIHSSNDTKRDAARIAINRTEQSGTLVVGSGEDRLSHRFTADNIKAEFLEDIPETFDGTFWADMTDSAKGGIAVTLFQAKQNFPKSLNVTTEQLTVGLIPPEQPVTMLQGMSKTHRFQLHLHGAEESLEQINVRSLQFQLPDQPIVETAAYERSGFVEALPADQKLTWVERAFYRMADGRAKTYGMLHWGDAPDRSYTNQGRGNGDWVWVNNEYDLPHAAMLLFARSGRRRFLDYMLRGVEHWKDVDIVHYSEDPLRYQGQVMHSGWHATGEVKICHQWTEGLLDYYHVTGDESALAAAIGIGENVRRNFDTPRYQTEGGSSARESGWALRSLGALYNETYDEKWLEAADRIVDHFAAWKQKFGAWLQPGAGHLAFRAVFMIAIAVNSLMRYYRIRPQERIKQMIVDAMEDLLEHCYVEDTGMFYYKEAPSTQRLHSNPIVLEALSYAYEFTGDVKYLEAGEATFQEALKQIAGSSVSAEREISGDAVIFWGTSPKQFAQYYYPLFYYYRTAVNAEFKL